MAELEGHGDVEMSGIIMGSGIDISDIGMGVIAILVQHGNLSIIQLFDPVSGAEESIGIRDHERGVVSIITLIPTRDCARLLILLQSDFESADSFAEIKVNILILRLLQEKSYDQSLGDGVGDLVPDTCVVVCIHNVLCGLRGEGYSWAVEDLVELVKEDCLDGTRSGIGRLFHSGSRGADGSGLSGGRNDGSVFQKDCMGVALRRGTFVLRDCSGQCRGLIGEVDG